MKYIRSFVYDIILILVAAITGSIISSTVLRPTPAVNESFPELDDDDPSLQFCGANDCGEATNNTNLAPVDDTTVGYYFLLKMFSIDR